MSNIEYISYVVYSVYDNYERFADRELVTLRVLARREKKPKPQRFRSDQMNTERLTRRAFDAHP